MAEGDFDIMEMQERYPEYDSMTIDECREEYNNLGQRMRLKLLADSDVDVSEN